MKNRKTISEAIKRNKEATVKVKRTMVTSCGYCQEENIECYYIFGPNTPHYPILSNKFLCEDCCRVFSDYYRKKSFYITEEEVKLIKQNEIADILRNIKVPSILSFTESNKIARLPYSVMNYSKRDYILRCDKESVHFNLFEDVPLMDYLEGLYNDFSLTKKELLTGDLKDKKRKEMGVNNIIKFLEKTEKLRGSYKYKILINFINKKEIEKNETDLRGSSDGPAGCVV